MDIVLARLIEVGFLVGLALGLIGAVAYIVWQWRHPNGYWTYGLLGRRWHNPRRVRYW